MAKSKTKDKNGNYWWITDINILSQNEAIEKYLEEKLHLYSNIKEHFDTIPQLKDILKSYMSQFASSVNKKELKVSTKDQLITSGVFHDEKILEFLLLISEKVRSFEDKPENASNQELGKYFFNKYKSQEKWPETDFNFYLKHNHSYQKENSPIIEEVVLNMIAHSRANTAAVLDKPEQEITHLIKKTDMYFQKWFLNIFGQLPPISLTKVTNITDEGNEYADRISGKTFIDIDNFRDQNKFVHITVHEGMHLCFNGFNNKRLEEGLIEYFIEKMFESAPSKDFVYSPVSETYQTFKNNLKSLFLAMPDAEYHFKAYFLTQDKKALFHFLEKNMNDEVKNLIKNEFWSSDIDSLVYSINNELEATLSRKVT